MLPLEQTLDLKAPTASLGPLRVSHLYVALMFLTAGMSIAVLVALFEFVGPGKNSKMKQQSR